MFDPDQVPLSTSEGRRPPSTGGDRMMVGLAVVALIGGLLIAVSRLIPEEPDQSSQATATPVESAELASPSPRPTRSPGPARTMTVDPAPLPTVAQSEPFASEWVRLRSGVTVMESPSSDHASGRLYRGEAAYVTDLPTAEGGTDGWLSVDGQITGWINGEIDDEAMFERFPPYRQGTSTVYGLASNDDGFTALGWAGTPAEEVMLASIDGTHWTTTQTPADAWGRTTANGPAGWLMAGQVDSPGTTRGTLWQSTDAGSWERLGALPEQITDGFLSLAGSQEGYVLLTNGSTGRTSVWFSADGLLWTERPVGQMPTDRGVRLTATPLGFFVWGLNPLTSQGGGAFSPDGWTWSKANPIGPGEIVDVVAHGDHLLALGRGPGGTRMWKGQIDGEALTWSPDNTAPFRGAVAATLVADVERVIVLGWDRRTETPLWWQRDGLTWQRHAMPAAFGGLPLEAAGGLMGVVAIGQDASAGGRTPVFWHLGTGAIWEREQFPVMPTPTQPNPRTCGPQPGDLLALLNSDALWTAICFGDAPITVRGWSVPCAGCYVASQGKFETEWLAQPNDRHVIHLAPIESGDWGALDGIRHPSARGQSAPLSRWLEVTGHFDDPDAASCRWIPTLVDEYWYTGTYDIVAGCRARFVVTSIRPVNGP